MTTAILLLACTALDDGWMPMNGTASSMNGKHPSVRMVSEVVKATVHRDTADVSCDFVFHNDGAACTVRMGFPAAAENDWEDPKERVNTKILKNFCSTVDGKPVKTSHLVLGDDEDPKKHFQIRQWEIKDVSFAKGATVRVHDSYTMPHGASAGDGKHILFHFCYILATGGTWKGKIGRADVSVTFAAGSIQGAPKFTPDKGLVGPDDQAYVNYWKTYLNNKNVVTYFGFGKVTKSGRTITFTKKDWSPDEEDNVILTFGLRNIKD